MNVPLGVARVLNRGFIVPIWGTQLMGTIEPNLEPLIYPPAEELSKIPVGMALELTVPPRQMEVPRHWRARDQWRCVDRLKSQEIPGVLVGFTYEETYDLLLFNKQNGREL